MKNKLQKRRKLASKKKGRSNIIHVKKDQMMCCISSEIIDKAKSGDLEALSLVLQYYDKQINDFTKVLCFSDDGDLFCKDDEKLKLAMKIGLVMAIIES